MKVHIKWILTEGVAHNDHNWYSDVSNWAILTHFSHWFVNCMCNKYVTGEQCPSWVKPSFIITKDKKKWKKKKKQGNNRDKRMEINDWFFFCRFQHEVSGGEISTCLISSHQHTWHIHLRSRQAGNAPEWQVWCHANCCFTEGGVTCPWMTYLWYTWWRTYCQKVLIFTSSASFKQMSF